MRTEQARPVRLDNYRPPDWLVETVELDVSLHPTATKVRATLKMSPNPKAGAPAPIVLDGDGLTLTSLKLDGQVMRPDSYVATPDSLTIAQPPAGTCYLQIETLVDPSANTQLMGLYRSSGSYCTQCEAEGFRRITYFPDRPDVMAVYTTRIEAEKSEAAVLLSNGNLVESGEIAGTTRHFAVWHDPFPKPAYLFALVGGNLACVEDKFVTMSGRSVTLRIYVEPGKEDRVALGDGFAQALDALGRGSVRPRIRSRHLHDRRGVRLQHGRDGEQGPERLQRQAGAGEPGQRDRCRLCQHRGGHRARVFPQLDRQPHHLPRLVPALPQGRADGLPRSGVHRPTSARARSSASRMCAPCARISSSRTRGPSPIRCGPPSTTRSAISTPRPSTRRAPRSCGC